MDGDSANSDESSSLQAIFSALDDPDCRQILTVLTEPMTAKDLTETCDIPQSTLYRKLDLLSQADLVHELIEVGPDGGRISRYERDVTDVRVSIDDEISISIDRPTRKVDERLAKMWSEMRDEL